MSDKKDYVKGVFQRESELVYEIVQAAKSSGLPDDSRLMSLVKKFEHHLTIRTLLLKKLRKEKDDRKRAGGSNKMYDRKETYSIEEILSKVIVGGRKDRSSKVLFGEDKINMASHRYQNFKKNGLSCVSCGITGQFFAKEKSRSRQESYHFNLYALDGSGNEVLMTKDHILPKSRGGKDHISNYQTMCLPCNNKKGNKIIIPASESKSPAPIACDRSSQLQSAL